MNTFKPKTVGLPDPLAPDTEKATPEYGVKFAEYIESEWFGGGMITAGNGCEFMERRRIIEEHRLFVRGESDPQYDKNHISRGDYDLDYTNLDWEQLNVPQKFCRLVSNGISDDAYKLDIRSFDRNSLINKQKKINQLRKDMRSKGMLEKAKAMLNVDLVPKGFVPEDDDELQLYVEIKERPKIEIAEEIMIEFVKRISNYQMIESTKNCDLVENGLAAARVYTDKNDGVRVAWIDIADFGHSRVTRNDFSDAYYFFNVDTITINDLRRESGFEETKLREIAQKYGDRNFGANKYNYLECPFNDLITIKVDIMRFAFKSSKSIVYKKKIRGGAIESVSRKNDNFNPPERSDYGKISKVLDTWYEGSYIIGCKEVYDYKECENLVRDEMNQARPPFIAFATGIYKNRLSSFLGDIKAVCKELQRIHLKVQQLVAELKPDLIEIDLDSLADLNGAKGDPKHRNWKLALSLLNVKGVVLTQRKNLGEMGVKDSASARPIPQSQGSAITVALNAWAHYYNVIRDITGINIARDGSLPPDALLGVNQMNQLASNTATAHIVETAKRFNVAVAETISARLHSIFKHEEAAHLRSIYENAIGKENVDALAPLADRALHEFGFSAEMLPTKQQLDGFKEDLQIAMKEGSIDVEVKMEAEAIAYRSVKLAHEYLKYRRRSGLKQKMQMEAAMAENKSKNDIAAAQAASEAQIKAYASQAQIDIDKEQRLSVIRLSELAQKNQIEAPKEAKEFEREVYLQQLETSTALNTTKYVEDRKDKRIDRQSSNNSKMIDQRQTGGAPIDFGNDLDWDDLLSPN